MNLEDLDLDREDAEREARFQKRRPLRGTTLGSPEDDDGDDDEDES